MRQLLTIGFIMFLLGGCVPVAECFARPSFSAIKQRMDCTGRTSSASPAMQLSNLAVVAFKESHYRLSSSINAISGSKNTYYNDSSIQPKVVSKMDPANKTELIDWTNYWYPIMPLSYLDDDDDMEDSPIPITILDTPLVIWRSATKTSDHFSNEYTVQADICPHRRAPLSTGKILSNKGNDIKGETTTKTLACRYHGWQFNKEGSCTHIPMMDMKNKKDDNSDRDESTILSKAFCAQSYPTQQRDGLLWVYMNPSETNLPALPAPVFPQSEIESANRPTERKYSYILNLFPVSFQSMIENSFDPSHAPFTHEALDPTQKSFITYLSENALPMERYELVKDTNGVETFSKEGFTVQHSPYMVSDGNNNPQSQLTTRQFIAPYTNVAQLPFVNMTLHFVPSRPGETLVYGVRATDVGKPQFLFYNTVLSKLIPQRFVNILQDFMHFYFTNLADSGYRFYNQDVQIMQGQDQRKLSHSSPTFWRDMYPTTSDRGVQFFQRWMNRFGGRPSYTMPSHVDVTSSNIDNRNPRIPSAWDRHAKYCPQCKRTIRRLSKISTFANKLSNASLVASMASLVISASFNRNLLSTPPRLVLPMVLLTLSILMQRFAMKCQQIVEQVFVPPKQVPHYQLMKIYSSHNGSEL